MSDCIFCKILAGKIPSHKLYEDDKTCVFLDAFPGTKGHTLIIPKKHYEDLFDIPDDQMTHLVQVSKRVAKALKEVLNFDGINFFQNTGRAAGQTVFHIHFHLFPRWSGDNALGGWSAATPDKDYFDGLKNQLIKML
ncbi:MAG: histidine triad protein [bacterium]|nr:MAG: histidine triad protein [bacterium]